MKSIHVREPVWIFSISINSGCHIPFFFSMDFRPNNVPFTVTITVTPDSSVIAYLAEDQVPAGWAVTNILVDGATLSGYTAFDSYHSEVKWGPFPDNTARVLSYQITPPANATGTFTLFSLPGSDAPHGRFRR